jgi:hypothetical protein
MAHLLPNSFSSYELTEEEEIQGSLLTTTQKQFIQNQVALCAEEKLVIEFDPAEPVLFAQHEAYKRGQLDAYKYLLELCEIAEETVRNNSAPPTN